MSILDSLHDKEHPQYLSVTFPNITVPKQLGVGKGWLTKTWPEWYQTSVMFIDAKKYIRIEVYDDCNYDLVAFTDDLCDYFQTFDPGHKCETFKRHVVSFE